ncbi:LacI family DNA-binding transcriptional regulator [Secundilactobacillus odoratitofui]|uniref:LacI family DNA-binding transcriptional regulator n=1 Tax=Secundilactobacillus odoratitofui TaxID=480930 RepID=UPI000A5033B0
MTQKVTIRDLAEAAGVSVTTVSQILNGKGERFSSDTQARVLKLQEKLGYVPDYNARNLIMRSTQTIGVLVPNLANPFFLVCLSKVSN